MAAQIKRVWLFLRIVWRKNQDYCLGVKLAWKVAGIMYPAA